MPYIHCYVALIIMKYVVIVYPSNNQHNYFEVIGIEDERWKCDILLENFKKPDSWVDVLYSIQKVKYNAT